VFQNNEIFDQLKTFFISIILLFEYFTLNGIAAKHQKRKLIVVFILFIYLPLYCVNSIVFYLEVDN